ncbi:hypothetical protein M9458_029639, partial [Cirrhinus mrigala]
MWITWNMKLFVEISNFTRYPDDCLCSFHHANCLCGVGTCVLWISFYHGHCGRQHQSHSRPRAQLTISKAQPKPAMIDKALPEGATALRISPKPEPHT